MKSSINEKTKFELLNFNNAHLLLMDRDPQAFSKIKRILHRILLANIESQLPNLMPKLNPLLLIAKEDSTIKGVIQLTPINTRGTCWKISKPIIRSSIKDSSKNLSQELIRQSLKIALRPNSYINWVISCSIEDIESLSFLRTLGFQPLKRYRQWFPTKSYLEINDSSPFEPDMKWEQITKSNIVELFKIIQSSDSISMRQILDRIPSDLFLAKNNLTGILSILNNSNKTIIAALTKSYASEKDNILKLSREVAWDRRLETMLPPCLKRLSSINQEINIDISTEDNHLEQLLSNLKWKVMHEHVILGKTQWRRLTSKSLKDSTTQLESAMKNLSPQNTVLPIYNSSHIKSY